MPKISDYPLTTPDPDAYIVISFGGQTYKVKTKNTQATAFSAVKMTPQVNEFLGSNLTNTIAPFIGVVITGGTLAQIASEANHPGIFRFTSALAGFSGAYVGLDALNTVLVAGGETGEFVFRTVNTASLVVRLGIQDSAAPANPTDGVWINIAGTTLNGKTANNTAISTTGTFYTITNNTWYRAKFVVNANATSVDFYLYDSSGNQLWTSALSSNIPTAVGRESGFFALSYWTAGAATNLIDLDWMALYNSLNTLTR